MIWHAPSGSYDEFPSSTAARRIAVAFGLIMTAAQASKFHTLSRTLKGSLEKSDGGRNVKPGWRPGEAMSSLMELVTKGPTKGSSVSYGGSWASKSTTQIPMLPILDSCLKREPQKRDRKQKIATASIKSTPCQSRTLIGYRSGKQLLVRSHNFKTCNLTPAILQCQNAAGSSSACGARLLLVLPFCSVVGLVGRSVETSRWVSIFSIFRWS